MLYSKCNSKVLAFLLALFMVLTMIPGVAYGEEAAQGIVQEEGQGEAPEDEGGVLGGEDQGIVEGPVDEADPYCILDCGIYTSEGGFSVTTTGINGEIGYEVKTPKNLAHINAHLNEHFVQTADIDLINGFQSGWKPIGYDNNNGFTGKYFGNKKSINNLWISLMKPGAESSNGDIFAGLFSKIDEGGHVEDINLSVSPVYINNSSHGGIYFGGIAGYQDQAPRTIKNCIVKLGGSITTITLGENDVMIGGVVGQNSGVIQDCIVNTPHTAVVNATAQGMVYMGGIAGVNSMNIERCISNTDISAHITASEAYVGGVTGRNSLEIMHSDHNGFITANTREGTPTLRVFVGGITGLVDDNTGKRAFIENCQNEGKLESFNWVSDDNSYRAYAGGIAGHIQEASGAGIEILNCANIGDNYHVYTKAPTTMTGGIAGSYRFIPDGSSIIKNCYNSSNILSRTTMVESKFGKSENLEPFGLCTGLAAGGIIGAAGGINIQMSYSYAEKVTATALTTEDAYVGGVAGLIWGTEFDETYYERQSLYDSHISNGVGGVVTPKAVDAMKAFALVKDDYEIESPVDDPNGVTQASKSELMSREFYNLGDLWRWYQGGGIEPHYYDQSSPWRMASEYSYPILRGNYPSPSTPPPAPAPSGGGSAIAAVVVTFMANDGTDTIVAKKTVADSKKILLPEEPQREGYTFIGWNEKVDRTSYTFTALTNVTKSMNVYAQWEKNQNVERPENSKYFKDMIGFKWAILEIDELHDLNVVFGVGADMYHPDVNITRADFMTMLVRAYGLNVEFSENFPDVPEGSYYYNAIGIAKALGIAEGDGNNFNPMDPITRQDAMALAHRTLNVIGFSLDPGADADLAVFGDTSVIASYAKDSIATLVKAGVINGKDGNIMPKDYTTRAEMAMIIYKMLNLV